MKPSKEELIKKLEERFGMLIPVVEHCAEDILENYESFIESIKSKRITIVASPNLLASKLPDPKYSKYKIYPGVSFLLNIAAIVSIFFNWEIGIALFVLAFILKSILNRIKTKTSLEFSDEIFSKFEHNPDEGMFDIYQYYIAGILQLSSLKGKAHLPYIPSNCLTGKTEFTRKE